MLCTASNHIVKRPDEIPVPRTFLRVRKRTGILVYMYCEQRNPGCQKRGQMSLLSGELRLSSLCSSDGTTTMASASCSDMNLGESYLDTTCYRAVAAKVYRDEARDTYCSRWHSPYFELLRCCLHRLLEMPSYLSFSYAGQDKEHDSNLSKTTGNRRKDKAQTFTTKISSCVDRTTE